MSKPLHRREGLVVEPLGDEVLVFDQEAQRAHSLNAAAAAVWEACDGTRDRDELAAHCGLESDAVGLALGSLANCDLLLDSGGPERRVSRRAVLRRAAVTGAGIGVAVPVIRSITAPSVAAAQSGCTPSGEACDFRTSCCSGSTCRGDSTCRNGGCGANSMAPCAVDRDCCWNWACASSGYCSYQSGA